MRVEATGIAGLHVLLAEPIHDERGLFARTYCRQEFAAGGLAFEPVQMSTSFNRVAGTLRGMHWQVAPGAETKLVRVTRGRVFDVVVDLRADSPTRHSCFGLQLDAESRNALLIGPGLAHGFITLDDSTEVLYAMDAPHAPAYARGARWDDPTLRIAWPRAPEVISERDRHWPDFVPGEAFR